MAGKHTLASVIILLYAVVGALVYTNYGISWDEEYQHSYGKVVYEYVFDGNQELHEHNSRYHGPAFQFILYSAEILGELTDTKEVFEMRHFLTFLVSVLGLLFFYRLLLQLKFSSFWASTGMLFLMLSPRIFAHSFYNSKDAVFMHLFIVSIYTMVKFLRKPNLRTALWHAVTCGFLIDVRILGAFVPVFTTIIWGLNSASDKSYAQSSIRSFIVFGCATGFFMIAFWPTLWHNPLVEFQAALAKMSAYPWDDEILFDGTFLIPQEMPWYYLPKWMIISSPIFVTVLSVIGIVSWSADSQLRKTTRLVPFLWVVIPLGMILWTNATVYDGWRHVFFLYPPIIIVATHGSRFVFQTVLTHRYATFIPLGFLLFPAFWMAKNHPHQNVYFNSLTANDAWKKYEMDYWGLSYKQAYEYLVQHQPEGELHVSVANTPGFYNHWTLSAKDQERIEFVDRTEASYFLSNLRFPQEHNGFQQQLPPYSQPLYVIEIDENPIMGIFKVEAKP